MVNVHAYKTVYALKEIAEDLLYSPEVRYAFLTMFLAPCQVPVFVSLEYPTSHSTFDQQGDWETT